MKNTTVSHALFFNDTATTEIYPLSLHDALPIYRHGGRRGVLPGLPRGPRPLALRGANRSEEHTAELQSRRDIVCRRLLEKKSELFFLSIGCLSRLVYVGRLITGENA